MENITDRIEGAAARGVTIEADYDEFCENPRGDDAGAEDRTWLWFYKPEGGESDAAAGDEFDFGWEDFRNFDGLVAAMRKASPGIEILPVYCYKHSGVAYNTTGFSCPWDSGLAGLIYITAPAIRARFGVKRLKNSDRERAREAMRNEVETYAAWANGDCWYVRITGADGEVIDLSGGFYGLDAAIAETAGMVSWYPLVDVA